MLMAHIGKISCIGVRSKCQVSICGVSVFHISRELISRNIVLRGCGIPIVLADELIADIESMKANAYWLTSQNAP
jgi:hypothetical protein